MRPMLQAHGTHDPFVKLIRCSLISRQRPNELSNLFAKIDDDTEMPVHAIFVANFITFSPLALCKTFYGGRNRDLRLEVLLFFSSTCLVGTKKFIIFFVHLFARTFGSSFL